MQGPDKIADLPTGAGMNDLRPEQFEPELLRVAHDFLPQIARVPVLICGMAGARQGWQEAPYATVPTVPADPSRAVPVQTNDPRLDVHILPGLCQTTPADVMRGEETQIAGYLTQDGDFDGILCLPGTHTKWVHVSAGEVVSFRTAMTGELFGLLAEHSVLRHLVSGSGWDEPAFLAAVDDAMSRPAAIATELFGIRAAALVAPDATNTARARLSGLLIGAELAAMRPYWLGQRVVLIGDPALSGHYQCALTAQGAMVEAATASELTLKGLFAAFSQTQSAA